MRLSVASRLVRRYFLVIPMIAPLLACHPSEERDGQVCFIGQGDYTRFFINVDWTRAIAFNETVLMEEEFTRCEAGVEICLSGIFVINFVPDEPYPMSFDGSPTKSGEYYHFRTNEAGEIMEFSSRTNLPNSELVYNLCEGETERLSLETAARRFQALGVP